MSARNYPCVAIYAGTPLLSCSFTKSIRQQVKRCWNYSNKRKWKVVHIFVDQNRKESLVERRNFRNMIEEARTGRFDNIVLYGLGYFCESSADVATAEKFLRESGVPFHSVSRTESTQLMLPNAKRKVRL
jgi:hypothetical protein